MSMAPRPGRPTEPSPWRGVELLDRAIAHARGSLALVTPDLMSAPTPCADWDLRALLVHMNDSLASLHEAVSDRRVRLDAVPPCPVWPVASLRARACQLLADWSAAEEARGYGSWTDVLVDDRPVTAPVLTSAGALEIAVHSWDVSVACASPRPLPEDLAAVLLRLSPALITDSDRPTRFAVPRVPPPGSGSGDRLLAFLGRDPGRSG